MLWLEIPAYAGSTSPAPAGQGPAPDHPRIRGEHRSTAGTTASRRGSSPHTRGAPRQSFRGVERPGIIPAYAGSTSATSSSTPRKPDHPRIRGEHLSRGCLRVLLGGIIPAYAGSTDGLPIAEWRRADHPRIRGEHRRTPDRRVAPGGSSPHTRGALRPAPRRVAPGGIIPAYAGSTACEAPPPAPPPDHPRIRGEHMSATPG